MSPPPGKYHPDGDPPEKMGPWRPDFQGDLRLSETASMDGKIHLLAASRCTPTNPKGIFGRTCDKLA